MEHLNSNVEGRHPGQRLLYIIHVDWSAPTKGRPQLLAQALAEHFDIKVLHRRDFRPGAIPEHFGIKNSPVLALPLERWKAIRLINRLLFRIQLFVTLALWRPEIVWITHPRFTPPRSWRRIFSCKWVYDCMDDLKAFGGINVEAAKGEPALLRQVDMVVSSAQNLAGRLLEAGAAPNRLRVVRNGLRQEWISSSVQKREPPLNSKVALYFGALAEWFDFQVILAALDQIPDLEFHLIGPAYVPVPGHPRLKLIEAVPHAELKRLAGVADLLVMPFLLTELVESVDPVKMYEYVALGPPIVARYYPEVEQFRPFTLFYDTEREFISSIRQGLARHIGTSAAESELRRQFLERSTWRARASELVSFLGELSLQNNR